MVAHSLRIEGVRDSVVKVNWQRPDTRNEREFWELAGVKREMGVSPQQILREYGYTDKQIASMRDELAEHTETMMGLAAKAFNEGAGIGERPAGDQGDDEGDRAE